MEKHTKVGSEITVRISVAFQEAPDVHTLLAMTPVRERGKLVRFALEKYIAETGHSAGNVEIQIEAISKWLRSRTNSMDKFDTVIPECSTLITSSSHDQGNTHDKSAIISEHSSQQISAVGPHEDHPIHDKGTSQSVTRWLNT